MRERTITSWICAIGCLAVFQTGCMGFGNKSEDGADVDAGVSYGSFCHGLTVDGGDVEVSLLLTKGDDQVSLTANTGECSTSLDAACKRIPVGDVSMKLKINKTPMIVASTTIEGASDYGFFLNLDDDSLPALHMRKATDKLGGCANSECAFLLYNASTCDPSDPCDWAEDGYCDEACLNRVDEMFDDAVDCSAASN